MATEKRLIDANAVDYENIMCSQSQLHWLNAIIEKQPTVDAVEVVRCKDCKYWKPGDSFGGDSLDDMQRIGGCPIMRFARRENDFCCEGERRTDAAQG